MKEYLRLMRYVVPYRGRIAVSVGCLLIASLLNAVSVASLQPAFDGLLGTEGNRQSPGLATGCARPRRSSGLTR